MAEEKKVAKKTRFAAPEDKGLSKLISRAIRNHQAHHKTIDYNRKHIFKDPIADPKLLKPFDDISFQSDEPRKAHVELKARATENHFVISLRATSGKETDEKETEKIAEAWNMAAIRQEELAGYEMQDRLFDGQSYDGGYGVLHCWRNDTKYPEIPEYEFCDELPEDNPDDYREVNDEDEDEIEGAKGRKYVRKEESITQELRDKRARAGFPYQWAVLDPKSVYFLGDSISEIAIAVHVRTLRLHDYRSELKTDGLNIDLTQDLKLRIYDSEVPSQGDETTVTSDYDQENIVVATVWTRDCWYELVSSAASVSPDMADGSWDLAKSGRHGFGRPPFFLALGDSFNHPDIARRYCAYLQGTLDLKPRFDFLMSLSLALSMATATKLIFLTDDGKAGPRLTEDGKTLDLVTDASQAKALPPGTDIKVVPNEVSQGFVMNLQFYHQLFKDSLPPVPSAEIGASTQPWTARQIVQQLSVVIKKAIKAQALCIQQMTRAILRDIGTPVEDGGFGDIAYVLRPGKDGREDEVVAIDPLKAPMMEISVAINAVTSAEQTVTTQHGALLLDQGKITADDFYKNYHIVPNPERYQEELLAEQIFNRQILPGLLMQGVGKYWGARLVIGPDGQLVNSAGQAVQPEQVLAANGVQKLNPEQMGSYGVQGGNTPQNMTIMPALRDNNRPPGVPQQQAMV